MESTTELPKRSYPDGCPEITGYGEKYPIIEEGARNLVIGALEWFDKNPGQHPEKHPEYLGMVDYVADEMGEEDLIQCISRLAEKNYLDPFLVSVCLKHIFIALRHGFDGYVHLLIEHRGVNEIPTK